MKAPSIEIRQIEKKDLNRARSFAETGMNLSRYVSNKLELYLYGWDVVYEALIESTLTLAAYNDKHLVGYLFARFDGDRPVFTSSWHKAYHHTFTRLSKFFAASKAADPYDVANKDMLDKLHPRPDGEIKLFAADPLFKGHGVGTLLLKELERLKKEKSVYLYTDRECTYQFYEHRGFTLAESRDIVLPTAQGELDFTCMLFTKTL